MWDNLVITQPFIAILPLDNPITLFDIPNASLPHPGHLTQTSRDHLLGVSMINNGRLG